MSQTSRMMSGEELGPGLIQIHRGEHGSGVASEDITGSLWQPVEQRWRWGEQGGISHESRFLAQVTGRTEPLSDMGGGVPTAHIQFLCTHTLTQEQVQPHTIIHV